MSLYLVEPAHGISLQIPVSESEERALVLQWARLKGAIARERFSERFGRQLTDAIADSLDWDIKAPTDAQLAYALVLSQKLGTDIPLSAKSSRLEMSLFLGKASVLLRDR
ncbi:hypothetical protein [Luteimonas fraxinea]|uniref:Uncharacterized protein n=1 Tax=Luteimonas fraxinea TaxID=2901869 RepID=A0ABS8UBA7_9GAMM|nr:hypothetical protein [Luteimonas fraxinea]MCD9096504.1 hypothetical protein [Luteimonas fraxinea]MCD9125846.1 hypothetical protein [Luteimonas fraxinea]